MSDFVKQFNLHILS